MSNPSLARLGNVATNVLLIAAWFGLVTGLLEGGLFLALQKLGLLPWEMAKIPVSTEIVWISSIFDLFLFGVLGLALVVVIRFFPRLPLTRWSVFLFAFLAFFDFLAVVLTGRIRHYAMVSLATGLAAVFTRWVHRHEAAALRFWRSSLPWVAVVALLALLGIQGGLWLWERIAVAGLPVASPGSPNILVTVVDTLRADHLSSYGYARPTSPNIDRLAQEGVLFETASATSSWTPPSHASLLTGRYPYEHGAGTKPLGGRYPTIGELLQERGYRTAAFSANANVFNRKNGFGRGFIRFEDYFHSMGDMALRTLYGRKFELFVLQRLGLEDYPARKRASDVNRAVLRWIERHPGRPFFAFLNYLDTHDPYLPPQPHRSKFSNLKNLGGILNSFLGRYAPKMTPEQLQGEIEAYDGAIAYVDDQIGQLLAELHTRGLGETTLVVFTSDHGEAFGEHGLFFHANTLYRELIYVPLIFWWPGRVPAGMRVAQPVTNASLPATVMELVGLGDQKLFPSPSLAQLWNASAAHPDWPSPLAEMAQIPWQSKEAPVYHGWMRSLVSPEWHYIKHEKLATELYDWKDDPQEVHNLAERPDMQNIVAWFRSQLLKDFSSGQTAAGKP